MYRLMYRLCVCALLLGGCIDFASLTSGDNTAGVDLLPGPDDAGMSDAALEMVDAAVEPDLSGDGSATTD